MRVFWRKGYASTTPQDLVTGLGIGKGSLYNTFTSKHRLFGLALLREALERLSAAPDDTLRPGCLAVNTAAELGGVDQIATEVVDGIFSRIESALQATAEHIEQENDTIVWPALRLGPTTYAVVDAFPHEAGRQAHLEAGRARLAAERDPGPPGRYLGGRLRRRRTGPGRGMGPRSHREP